MMDVREENCLKVMSKEAIFVAWQNWRCFGKNGFKFFAFPDELPPVVGRDASRLSITTFQTYDSYGSKYYRVATFVVGGSPIKFAGTAIFRAGNEPHWEIISNLGKLFVNDRGEAYTTQKRMIRSYDR